MTFHTFTLTNTKTGTSLDITQIGATAAAAEHIIRNFNFAGIDWTHRTLKLKGDPTYSVTKLITNYKDDARPHTTSGLSYRDAVEIAERAQEHPCFVWAKITDESGKVLTAFEGWE